MTHNVNKTTDLTIGKPLKCILIFAIPLLIGNVFQQLYSLVDTGIAGHLLGDNAIAAIGSISSIHAFILDFAIGINLGCGFLVTQIFGAKDLKGIKESIAGMIILNVTFNILLSLLYIVFLNPFMHFLQVPEDIYHEAYLYILVISIGMLATTLYNMCSGILRSFGNSRIPLYFLILASFLNVGLDFLFIGVFNMGVVGAAIATVLSQLISGLGCLIVIIKDYSEYLPKKEDFKVTKNTYITLLTNGISMAIMYCVVDIGTIFFLRSNNALGPNIIAAYTASRRIFSLFSTFNSTIGSATATFVGQNFGAKKKDRVNEGLKKSTLIILIWSIFAIICSHTLSEVFIKLITGTNNPEIIKQGALSVRWHLDFLFPLGLLIMFRTSMQGINMRIAPIISSIMELVVKIVAAFIFIPKLGFLGTVITEPISWIIMFIFLFIYFISVQKKYLDKYC